LSEAFPVEKVTAAAEKLLHHDRFDADLLVSEVDSDSDEDSSSNEPSDSANDSDSSESEKEFFPKRQVKKGRHKEKVKSKPKKEKGTHNDTNSSKSTSVEPMNEMETLIKKMGSISLGDPEYALLFYRATRIDPYIKDIIAAPMRQGERTLHSQGTRRNTSTSYSEETRDTSKAPIENRAQQEDRFYQLPNTSFQEQICYGCGDKGHSIPTCPQISTLVRDGKLMRLNTGRVVRTDRNLIRRKPNETVIEAFRREDPVLESHFVKIKTDEMLHDIESVMPLKKSKSAYIEEYKSNESELALNESDGNDSASTQDTSTNKENLVYPVERVTQNLRRAGYERLGNNPMPIQVKEPKKISEKRRHSENLPEGKLAPKRAKLAAENMPNNSPREQPSKEKLVKERVKKNIPDTGWTSEDIVVDEVPAERRDLPAQRHPNTHQDNLNTDRKYPKRRVSDIMAKVQPGEILDTILRTPIKMEIGELLSSSRELSGLLSNAIKPKSVEPRIEAHSVWTKTQGLLIKVAMQCDGRTISAIIDTGSQLNIVSSYIWKTIINRPIDIAKSVSLSDANGGEGRLRGLIQNVPLNCGGVFTHANLFVGDHVPFNLLLGQPWQRSNYVSIDERSDGTWLLFKDPLNLEVWYELLCTPEEADPNLEYETPTLGNLTGVSLFLAENGKLPFSDENLTDRSDADSGNQTALENIKSPHPNQFLSNKLVSDRVSYSDQFEIEYIPKSIKKPPDCKIYHPVKRFVSIWQNHLSVRKFPYLVLHPNMPYTPLSDTRSEISEFVSQHPGNFCFSTSIENDALTFSFEPFFTISNPSMSNYSRYTTTTRLQ